MTTIVNIQTTEEWLNEINSDPKYQPPAWMLAGISEHPVATLIRTIDRKKELVHSAKKEMKPEAHNSPKSFMVKLRYHLKPDRISGYWENGYGRVYIPQDNLKLHMMYRNVHGVITSEEDLLPYGVKPFVLIGGEQLIYCECVKKNSLGDRGLSNTVIGCGGFRFSGKKEWAWSSAISIKQKCHLISKKSMLEYLRQNGNKIPKSKSKKLILEEMFKL